MLTTTLILVGLALAALGAWDTSRTRHGMTSEHRRRKGDK